MFGNAEECNSSESGWTMYICSPITNEDDEVDRGDRIDGGDFKNDDDDVHDHVKHDEVEHDSDDSMASDASSGPSHRQESRGNGKDEGKISSSKKKAKDPVGKNGKKQEKEEGSGFTTAKGASFGVQSSEKVGKNTWFGKRK